jgi:hypothetical protein
MGPKRIMESNVSERIKSCATGQESIYTRLNWRRGPISHGGSSTACGNEMDGVHALHLWRTM